MKQMIKNILMSLLFASVFASCNDFLDILPKGEKIPQTLADYEALLRDEYGNMTANISQISYLMNERYLAKASRSYSPLETANYMWDESADRIELNKSDEAAFYGQYRVISNCNLIIENYQDATEATETEKKEVAAYATVVRAMSYYILVNYYSDAYVESTADEKGGIPLIESANINASYEQVSVKKIYDYITSTVEAAIKDLPSQSMTILHPNKGAAYAFLARVYLTMANYSKALEYANLALGENNQLYDWVAYYNTYKESIENPDSYTSLPSPMGYDYIENYNFKHGMTYYASSEASIPVHRAEQFEEGDAKTTARWKFMESGADKYMKGITSGVFNHSGMTTVEVYLIKAECLVRNNSIAEAMDLLDQVRQTRILPEYYTKLTATDVNEAMKHIMRTKSNEMILTIVPFTDARRLNAEGKWPVSLTKVEDGQTLSLSPNSHMWTMPFPNGAIKSAGNGTLTQNVSK